VANDALINEIETRRPPEALLDQLRGEPGVVLLHSALLDSPNARYSFVAARPFLTFRSFGSRCELSAPSTPPEGRIQFGNPWNLLDGLMSRYELLDEVDLPFPLGGCFGYWGYDLKNFVEPKLGRRAPNDLELPDCRVGFYDSLVVFDHRLSRTWIVSTGLEVDGSRNEDKKQTQLEFWRTILHQSAVGEAVPGAQGFPAPLEPPLPGVPMAAPSPRGDDNVIEIRSADFRPLPRGPGETGGIGPKSALRLPGTPPHSRREEGRAEVKTDLSPHRVKSSFSRAGFIAAVERAQRYIVAGDIYQVNLAQRLAARCPLTGWEFFQRLAAVSPAPFTAFLDCGEFQIASSSPEMFLRLSGAHIQTRPIKGTRPRDSDPARDARLTWELQTSAKEMTELVMITDLLRNDLGKVCEYGSVRVPELARLERYRQVQHLVSTVTGRLRPGVTHFAAFASCFPGGSITGAPKIRAMEIIDELEPVARGPYTGALGYLGFNRESQLSILIRAAICREQTAYFHVGAGIVADSTPAAEYDETLAKARGFFEALNSPGDSGYVVLTAEH